MKKINGFTVFLTLLLLFSGCSKSPKALENTQALFKADSQEGRIVLTYGYIDSDNMLGHDSGMDERVISFNQTQDEYYIEIIRYGEGGSWSDGVNALNADIAAGKGPDIIELDDSLSVELGKKGIIEDLNEYLQEDSVLQREDFVENALECFEDDGHLYAVPQSFVIQTTLANPNYVMEEFISFEEMMHYCEEYADDEVIMVHNNLTKLYFENNSILASIPELVVDGKCHFDSEKFKSMVQKLDGFRDYYVQTQDERVDEYIKLGANELIFIYDGAISDFSQYSFLSGLLGDNLLLVGKPTIKGQTPTLESYASRLAINHSSTHKQVAWEFICTTFETQYQVKNYEGLGVVEFPIIKDAFEQCAQKEIKKGQNNVSGEVGFETISGKTIYFPQGRFTQEQLDYLYSVINKIEPRSNYSDIEQIVAEEIEAYWNGVSDLDKAISNIQNRVQLLLDEQ